MRECWGEDRLFYCDGSGSLSYIPAAWTDFPPEDLFVKAAGGQSRLHVDGLLRLVTLADALVQKNVK